jgi:hypothetical protein
MKMMLKKHKKRRKGKIRKRIIKSKRFPNNKLKIILKLLTLKLNSNSSITNRNNYHYNKVL